MLENGSMARHPILKKYAAKMVSTPAEHARYFSWYKRWLSEITGEPVSTISIYETTLHYNGQQQIVADSSLLLYDIR